MKKTVSVLVALVLGAIVLCTGCPPLPQNPVNCPMTQAGATCYNNQTGAARPSDGTHLSETQVVDPNGTHPLGDKVTGVFRVTADNTTVDGLWLEGCISVQANNFKLKHSLIVGTVGCAGGDGTSASSYAVNNGGCHNPGNYHMDLSDVEIDVGQGTDDYAGLGTCNYTLTRVNVHGGTKNVWAGSNVTSTDSYFHGMTPNAGQNHEASFDADSSDHINIQHSYIDSSGAGATTGAADFNTTWGPSSFITVNNSFMRGGKGYDLVAGGAVYRDNNMTVTNNFFSSDNGHSSTNYVELWDTSQSGMTFTGNVLAEDPTKTVNSDGSVT